MKKFAIGGLLVVLAIFCGSAVWAQSVTAGDISGVVTDATGAVIPNAKVTVTNTVNGGIHVTSASDLGSYRVSLLVPGSYTVSVTAPGFTTTTSTVLVAAGAVSTANLSLSVGHADTVVEVTGSFEIINTENGDVTTAFTTEQVQALPNPGNDLTYVAQTAPGSVMNTGTTAGGYGNFSSFGISGLSNMFTLDGGYENDPFLNLNNTGASNLTLGNNEVDTVTVISPAFSSQFGGLGGAQVNEITTAGTNRLHGNLSYFWDGRALNSNDWFNKQNEAFYGLKNQPVFVNANQWGASIGGPIKKDKLFFFVNTEGIRATTPATADVTAPNAAMEACTRGSDPGGTRTLIDGSTQTYTSCATLNAAADNGTINALAGKASTNPDEVGNLGDGIPFAAAPASQLAQMNRIYNTFDTSPLRPPASQVTQDANDPATVIYLAHNSAFLPEWQLTARVDYKIGAKDNYFIHYKQDKGTQPTFVDLISPLFSALSPQPSWEGQMSETHQFTTSLVNQLVLTGNYYSAPFQNTNNYSAAAPLTIIFISGELGNSDNGNEYYGGLNYAFPQGRRVSGYQVIDDVNYTKGRNTLRFGYNFRRDNITDYQGEETVAPAEEGTEEGFVGGRIDYEHIQRFPSKPTFPVAVYNEGAYVEDSFKVTPNLILTAGLRVERNSNPTCIDNCLQTLSTTTAAMATGSTIPYNAAFTGGYILSNRHRSFLGYQKFAAMPRVAFNYQPFGDDKTVVRGGFGMFSDTFPGLIAEDLLSNAPNNFHAIVYGTVGGGAADLSIDPSTAGSGAIIAAQSNTAFQNLFKTGGTYTTTAAAVAAVGGHYSAPSFTTTAPFIKYPTYEEYSLAVERKIGSKSTVSILYVGNHGYDEPVNNGTRNLTITHTSATYFPTIPTAKPITSFATISNVYAGASSNFNGLVLSTTRRSKELTLQFNYQFSKALDDISNGGLEGFAPDAGDSEAVSNPNSLRSQYGPADYNVKHNITSSFVYEVPTFTQRFKEITGGYEINGDVFHQSGLPYTVTASITAPAPVAGTTVGSFANGTINLFARQLNNNFDHHCGSSLHVALPDGSVPNQCNFATSFGGPTNFGQQGRNSLVGPSYTNVNLGLFKSFAIPHYESMKLKVGAQFFNLFNHPNFQNPAHIVSSSSASTIGGITGTVGAPTSILGSVGAADASARLIQLHGTITF